LRNKTPTAAGGVSFIRIVVTVTNISAWPEDVITYLSHENENHTTIRIIP